MSSGSRITPCGVSNGEVEDRDIMTLREEKIAFKRAYRKQPPLSPRYERLDFERVVYIE
jgi:hypothetical protein